MRRAFVFFVLAMAGLDAAPDVSRSCVAEGDRVVTTTSDGRCQVIEERSRTGRFRERLWLSASGQSLFHERLVPTDPFGSAELHQSAGDRHRSISWTISEGGRLQAVQGVAALMTYEYDPFGRCIIKRTNNRREIRYEWDDKNRLTRIFSADGTADYQYAYDGSDRICSAYDAVTGHIVRRSFDDQDRVTSDGEEGAGLRVDYDNEAIARIALPDGTALCYSDSGLVQRIGADLPWTIKPSRPSCSTLIENQEAVHHNDPLGSWDASFEYDELNQLQRESGEWNQNYGFDLFGLSGRSEAGEYDDDGSLRLFRDGEKVWIYTYDVLGRLSSASCGDFEEQYRYDGFGRLQEIVTNTGSKRLLWFDETNIGTVSNGLITDLLILSCYSVPIAVEIDGKVFFVDVDSRGSITALIDPETDGPVEVYRYSAFGHVHTYGGSEQEILDQPSCPWLYCGRRWLEGAQVYDFGPRRYFLQTLRWAEQDPFGLVDTPDDRVYVRNNPVAFADPSGLLPVLSWISLKKSLSEAASTVAANVYKSMTFAKSRLDWLLEIRSTYEDLFFELIGQSWLHMLGYNFDPSDKGTYGGKDALPKVRITLINGMLNGISDTEENAELFSSTHGKVPIHFIYAATDGFASDLFRAFLGKAGVVSRQAKMLASLWKELIKEMGGPDGGGMILHYAHSLGATDTFNALRFLEPAERKCIRVVTFGSPTLIEDGVCAKVDNYVSLRDGVPSLDVWRYYKGGENIHFLQSDVAFPLDHLMTGKTYRTVIETLGLKFQEEFLLAR